MHVAARGRTFGVASPESAARGTAASIQFTCCLTVPSPLVEATVFAAACVIASNACGAAYPEEAVAAAPAYALKPAAAAAVTGEAAAVYLYYGAAAERVTAAFSCCLRHVVQGKDIIAKSLTQQQQQRCVLQCSSFFVAQQPQTAMWQPLGQ